MSKNQVNIALVGGGGTGKSCITIQYVQSHYDDNVYDPTISDSYIKQIGLQDDGLVVDLHILDTAGQEEYEAMVDMDMRQPRTGFMIVYAIDSRDSFEQAKVFVTRLARAQDVDDVSVVPILLVANKCDLEATRAVTTSEGAAFAASIGATFLETSAKCRINVEEAFVTLATMTHRRYYGKESGNGGGGGGGKKTTGSSTRQRSPRRHWWQRIRFRLPIAMSD